MKKNKFFSIVLAICLIMPAGVMAEDMYSNMLNQLPEASAQTESSIPSGTETSAVEPETNQPEVIEPAQQTFKQPVSKRKIAKKFLAAMLGVAVSSFLIFFLLSVYNRLRERFLNQIKTPDGETSLETPNDLEGAVKTFLDKTEWNNKL